ncbi:hypothetical protein AB6A40_000359 [Gnathostoma spinigerum]|uniref:CHK kinase-like domain-containing protein n=1 Tax=Gnathostoma spinigerum TaxID=75299 RepID=A0ABD6EBJ2_9BILA
MVTNYSSSYFYNTKYDIDFILEQLRINLTDPIGNNRTDYSKKNMVNFETEDIGGEAAFFGRILRVEFTWRNPQNNVQSLVLKLPTVSRATSFMSGPLKLNDAEAEAKCSANMVYLEFAHMNEISFYRTFKEIRDKLLIPRFYFGFPYVKSDNEGIIAMEDMRPTTVVIQPLPGFKLPYLKSLAIYVARLQHYCAFSGASINQFRKDNEKESICYIQMATHMSKTFVNECRTDLKPFFDKLQHLFTLDNYYNCVFDKPKFGSSAVVCHGDFWSNNILWKKGPNGEPTPEIGSVVDWQTTHLGNYCEDLMRALTLHVSGEERLRITDEILRIYHSTLTELNNGIEPFTFQNVKQAYKAALPSVTLFMGFGVSMYYYMPSVCPDEAMKEELISRYKILLLEVIEEYHL